MPLMQRRLQGGNGGAPASAVRNASPQSPRIQALALLYKKRQADGSCLRCGEQGHVKRECTAAPQPFEKERLRAANLFVFAAGRGRTITATVPRGDGTKVTVALDTCAGVSLVDLGMFKGSSLEYKMRAG